ncbi:hypothetical protein A6R74_17690 [Halomonas sp. ALS9]|nr:hypothetical protein A6R74_17690 [Halomonas sp. ALS9]
MTNFKYIKLFVICGVPVFMHWSLSMVLLLLVLYSAADVSMLIAAISFFTIMFFHELGHMWFAAKLGLKSLKIKLYLFHGRFCFEESNNEYHTCLVAWGGVVVQAIIFIPCIVIFSLYSDVLPWFVNLPLVILGYINALIAVFNLIPAKGLDGRRCWKSISLYFRYGRSKASRHKNRKKHLRSIK